MQLSTKMVLLKNLLISFVRRGIEKVLSGSHAKVMNIIDWFMFSLQLEEISSAQCVICQKISNVEMFMDEVIMAKIK